MFKFKKYLLIIMLITFIFNIGMFTMNYNFFVNAAEVKAPTLTPGKSYYPAPPVYPPAEHPRLYIRAKDIPALKERIQHPEMADAWKRLNEDYRRATDGKLKPTAAGSYLEGVRKTIEATAFMYLIDKDPEVGKKAIRIGHNFLETVTFQQGKMDVTREMGVAMVASALVYDWCYDLMSKEEKQFFIDYMYKICQQMEIGFPPTKQDALGSHATEAQLYRDVLGTAVAIYDEDKELYNIAAGRFFKEFVPLNNLFYPSHMHPQGDSYGPFRFQWEVFATFLFDRMGHGNPWSSEQGMIPYHWLYTRRADGQMMRTADTLASGNNMGNYWYYHDNSLAAMLISSYYKDPYIKNEYLRQVNKVKGEPIWTLLFLDTNVESKPLNDLPLTKYFPSPMGSMVARTGWKNGLDSPAVVADMRIVETYFQGHMQQDAGSFQLYYKGGLAISSGIYQGKDKNGTTMPFANKHHSNYTCRVISKNSMLVYDPNEKVYFMYNTDSNVPDGGQKAPGYTELNKSTASDIVKSGKVLTELNIAKVVGQQFGPDQNVPEYTYLKGDLTKAYSEKMKQYYRSFVFLNLEDKDHPAAMIVYDKVVSSNPDFKKFWLLHSVEDPEIKENVTTITRSTHGYNGKLVNTTLFPAKDNLIINKVGGPGKEYWLPKRDEGNGLDVGVNYEIFARGNNSYDAFEAGTWRVEVSPKKAATTDLFLNVMQVMDNKGGPAPLPTEKIESDTMIGTKIADRVVLFSKDGERRKDTITFEVAGNESKLKYLVTDVAEGFWKIEKAGEAAAVQCESTKDGGVIYFDGTPGKYTLTLEAARTLSAPVYDLNKPRETLDTIEVMLKNQFLYFDVPPMTKNDRVMVPMRTIFEKLAATVEWDANTNTVTATKRDTTIVLKIDSTTATVNGEVKQLDAPATVVNGRTLVLIRFVSEALDAKVTWSDVQKIVTIVPAGGGS